MATQDLFLLISLGIIILWTFRLARAKGVNPWIWTVGVALLIALTWNFAQQFLPMVAMAPLIFLLLFRSPLFRRMRKPESRPCPNCGVADAVGRNFCVQCGWDLSRAPEPEVGNEGTVEGLSAVAQDSPIGSAPNGSEVATSDRREVDVSGATPPSEESARATEPVIAAETTVAPVEPEQEAPQPAPKPPSQLPTPANMTERGASLFNQGRYQEAIDQFTKAIALDPTFREAWQRRAEAYGKLGRQEQQNADLRRLEAI